MTAQDGVAKEGNAPVGYHGASLERKKSLIEEHFNIDQHFRMIGALCVDPDFRRDVHDVFNLVVLIPISILNLMNWNWPLILSFQVSSVQNAWVGDHFWSFWWASAAYFLIDLLWVMVIKGTVKSPTTILVHHSIVLIYLITPRSHPQMRWGMGACMSVEINTWFLIARRVFNRKGMNPFVYTGCAGDMGEISVPMTDFTDKGTRWIRLRIKGTSIGFYVTWFAIRLVLYPALIHPFWEFYNEHSAAVGSRVNLILVVPVFQVALTFLNIKWSIDLYRSKMRSKGIDKGL